MAKYTMELREILQSRPTIISAIDFPVIETSYKDYLVSMMENYFYFREIGMETVDRFEFHLKEWLTRRMPFYNQLYATEFSRMPYEVFNNYDVTETYTKTSTDTGSTEVTTSEDVSSSASNTNNQLMSDTPNGQVDFTTTKFVSGMNKETGTGSTTSNSDGNTTSESTNTNVENWERKLYGNYGTQPNSETLQQFRKTIIDINTQLLEEMGKELFMGVY